MVAYYDLASAPPGQNPAWLVLSSEVISMESSQHPHSLASLPPFASI